MLLPKPAAGPLPEEVVEVEKRTRFISHRMAVSIANHEPEKARFYSAEQRKELDNLRQLREKYKLDVKIHRENIERAVSKLVGLPIEMIRRLQTGNPEDSGPTLN